MWSAIIVLVLLVFGFFSFSQWTTEASNINQNTVVIFNQKVADMGAIRQGNPKTICFKFKNTGNVPLVIYNVEPSCGCTGAEWPQKPVKPGKENEIKLTFDAKEPGVFMKNIDVYGNFEGGLVQLSIKGEVISNVDNECND